MRRALIIVVVLLLLGGIVAGGLLFFGAGSEEAKSEPIRVASSGSTSYLAFGSPGTATSAPAARLPGITVLGSGEVEVKPDTAIVRLTVGSGSSGVSIPQSGGQDVELIDEDELDPIVDAVVDAGAPRDEIYVDAFANSNFGPDNTAATITLEWPRPEDVRKVLEAAQRAVRKTDLSLEDVAVAFMRDDCDAADEDVANAALADARKRAERLASLSHAKLGGLVAVSEASASSYLSLVTQQRCGIDATAPGALDYPGGAATADKMKISTTLEVTFALDR